MEIIKKQLFESLSKNGGVDKIFIELTTRQRYRKPIKKSSKSKSNEEDQEVEIIKFNFTEFFNWLPVKDYSELFLNLKENKLVPLIDDDLLSPSFDATENGDIVDENSIKNQEQVVINSLNTFSGIVELVKYFLLTIVDKPSSSSSKNQKQQQDHQQQQQLPNELFEILNTIHEIILQFENYSEKIVEERIYSEEISNKLKVMYGRLSNDMSQCCEIWIRHKKNGYDGLVPQCVSYLLTKSAGSDVIANITRLNKVRHGLTTLDFTDPNIRTFIELLLACFIHPQFIKTDEGKKFLIYLFSVKASLIEQIHQTVKGQLLHANKTTRDSYAEIYFKAWKVATGPFLVKIEYHCIQNLMEVAIHCSDVKLSKNLNAFLHYFHNQKPYKEVDPMLYRLYEPILFRSLNVSHPQVRTNAARLFYDSFPLKKSNEDTHEEADNEMNMQFKLLKDIFDDPAVPVRVVAIEGTFEVLGKFWELLPLSVSRSLLSKIINELAFDKSSSLVREAVFIGIRSLLDNSLSHSTLKVLLPNLKNLIHDTSDRVREAFADLLLFIKGISTIRFFDIVPVEHLLERMILDYKNTKLSKKMTQLIVELYFPPDAKKWDLINNCIQFFKNKKQAAFTFYSNLVNFVPVLSVAKFVCSLFNYLIKFSTQNCDINELPISLIKQPIKYKEGEKVEGEEEEEVEEEEVGISIEDCESILEIISLILISLKPLLSNKDEFQKTKSSMLTVFNNDDITNIYLWLFTANIPRIGGMCKIINIASQFSLENFPTLKDLLLQNFQEIDSTTPDILKETLLQSLFSWELPKQVLKIIINSINLPFKRLFNNEEDVEESEEEESEEETKLSKRKRNSKKSKSKSKSKKTTTDDDDEENVKISFEKVCEKANISVIFLDMLFRNETSRIKVLKEEDLFAEMISSFQSYLPIISRKLAIECNSKSIIEEEEPEEEEAKDKEEVEAAKKINNNILKKLNRGLLVSCFTMYAKILFHSEALNEKLVKDSGYFGDIFDFGKLLIKLLNDFTKNKQSSVNKRSRSIDDDDDEDEEKEEKEEKEEEFKLKNEKPFILEILEIYLLIISESLIFGLFSSDSCIQFGEELSEIIKITKGNVGGGHNFNAIIPIIAKYSLQLYNYSISGGDPRLQDNSYKLLFELFDFINSSPSIKKKLQDNYNGTLSIFKFTDYLAIHHQKGSLNVIIKLLIEQQIFKEFNKILNISPDFDEQLEFLESIQQLQLPSNQFIIQTLSKSSPCINQIGNYLNSFVNSQSMNQKSIYYSLNLISIIIYNNLNSKNVDLSPLTGILINFISQLPSLVSMNEDDIGDEDDEDEDDEALKQLKLSKNSKIKYSILLSYSNDLFNLLTNEREKEVKEKPQKNVNNNNNNNNNNKKTKNNNNKNVKKSTTTTTKKK